MASFCALDAESHLGGPLAGLGLVDYESAAMKTKRSQLKAAQLDVEIRHETVSRLGRLNLVMHTIATGGVVVIGDQLQIRLTPVQFAFLEQLARQASEDERKHESVRGFVSSSVLICTLPWDSVHPEASHLKQLVRRLRRRLAGSGIEIESMFGLGYRVLCVAEAAG
jgi:DNA-binding response OmpR family regulator